MFTLAGGAAAAWGQLDPNDPWPKFAHDERNTCYTSNRGPATKPQLRWWARLGYDPEPTLSQHLHGPAVARLGPNNVRHVLVGTRDVDGENATGRVLIFRFHPDAYHWGDGELEARPVQTLPVGAPVNSTPLVMPGDLVAVQTEAQIQVWDLSDVANPVEVWWANLESHGSSPAYASFVAAGGNGYLYVLGGDGILYCIDPDDPNLSGLINLATARVWLEPLSNTDHGGTSPAIGAIADDPAESDRNFVYVSTMASSDEPHLFALFADGHDIDGNVGDPVAWSHGINVGPGFKIGTLASPSVHDASIWHPAPNQVVIGSDDYNFYGFRNECQEHGQSNWPRRWLFNAGWYVSGTAGLTPQGDMILWNENAQIFDLTDGGTWTLNGSVDLDAGAGWVHGAPVLDSAGRFYVNTPGNGGSGTDAALVFAYERPLTDGDYPAWSWGTENDMPVQDPGPPKVLVPRLGFGAPCAMDADGTLLCVSFGYIFALRPRLGDFAGNGGADISDLGAMRMALTDPLRWEEQYGAVYGINLLGVGDADDDDAFAICDVPALVDAMANGDNDWATDEDWRAFRDAVDALYDDLGMEDSGC